MFFDRTKPLDLRPEVMDIFAEAIGRMVRRRHARQPHHYIQLYIDNSIGRWHHNGV